MKTQKITAFIGKTGAVASLVAASAAATGFLAPSASATSLVPQMETEVFVGIDCIDASLCLTDLTPYHISSIESLVDSTTGTMSRLFVDDLATENVYGTVGTNPFVRFTVGDEGTVPAGFWYRPSEVKPNGQGEEQGRLEVGTYTFNFTDIIPELKISYFDTETDDTTGILATDGTILGDAFVSSGPNGNIMYQTLTNVSTLTIKLGFDRVNGTGDGVDFQLEKVPEPGTALGLGALAFMSTLGLRKRNKKAN